MPEVVQRKARFLYSMLIHLKQKQIERAPRQERKGKIRIQMTLAGAGI